MPAWMIGTSMPNRAHTRLLAFMESKVRALSPGFKRRFKHQAVVRDKPWILDNGRVLLLARVGHSLPRPCSQDSALRQMLCPCVHIQRQIPPQVELGKATPRRLVAEQHGAAMGPSFHHSMSKILVSGRHQQRMTSRPHLAKRAGRHCARHAPPSTPDAGHGQQALEVGLVFRRPHQFNGDLLAPRSTLCSASSAKWMFFFGD